MARARYSTSEEERDTVFCFLDFHDTREVPKKIQNLVIERLVAQSKLLNAFNCIVELAAKNNPWAGLDFVVFMIPLVVVVGNDITFNPKP